MISKELDNLLNHLELKDSGVVFFGNEEGKFEVSLHFDTRKKLELIKPNAIYVFNKQPFILFFDLTGLADEEREDDIHKKVWSFDNSPIIFIIKDKEIIVYNALNYVKQERRLEQIPFKTEDERNKQFSFLNLQSGATWKWLQTEYLKKSSKNIRQKRVNETLFKNIKDVREKLTNLNLQEHHANSLILRLIFIRYLIDRGIEINNDYISGETTNERRKCFCELITQIQRLKSLFEYLNSRFNGVLFKDLDFTINDTHTEFLTKVFRGELQGNDSLFEGYFFEIFDFSIIPVEMISGIYESLINEETKKNNSAVYTPPFLVDYILTDTVDKYLEHSQTSDCKIFEVAVGSGIFLVQSLRRMIEKEIQLNKQTTDLEFSVKIRKIALDNLFGIDINEEALKVACFSIYIALLDYQKPQNIDKYEFPDLLNNNLFEANFFDVKHPYNKIIKSKKLDFILGNPPWKSKKDDKIHIKWLKDNKKTVGGYEIAQSFLLRTNDFMHSETKSALIVTSTMFNNVSKTTQQFKSNFLKTYCVEKFFDLSPVRRLIFEEKDSPASIVYFRKPRIDEDFNKNIVNHQSLKINYFLKYFRMLVIEKFDQKEIQQKHFIDNPWMFKVALYGNVLDFLLLKKIKDISDNKILNLIDNNIFFGGSGITIGGEQAEKNNEKKIFPFIEGLPVLENNQIKPFYTPDSSTLLERKDCYIKCGCKRQLFEGFKILFKRRTKDEYELIISVNENTNVFKFGVYGISSTKNKDKLIRLFGFLNSYLYTYYIYLISGAWGISTRPEVKWKDEYLSFPIVQLSSDTETELINLVNQFLKPYQEHYTDFKLSEPEPDETILAKINEIIYDLYGINGYEKDLIDYVLNVSRYQFQESKQNLLEFSNDKTHNRYRNHVLENYAEVYLQEFRKIYTDEYIQVEIYLLDHFIAMNFIFMDSEPTKKIIYPKDNTEKEVFKLFSDKLSISQETNTSNPIDNLFIQKDIKGFEANSFYIIKPNEYKCWHRAMAWYDVAEFKEAIQKAELKRLNGSTDND